MNHEIHGDYKLYRQDGKVFMAVCQNCYRKLLRWPHESAKAFEQRLSSHTSDHIPPEATRVEWPPFYG